ncbi:DUF262 domain-containing protein [Streptococcus gordonii]|uniref:DUF262 domain-containing protein n=1 Tax=Streptococcus gordonii TaxID=1302 RepID=UPI00073AE866|nr:DUF262 domain-containing protein [Streptococcus gordonii]KTF20287.1 hypothetical protein AT460_08460 [Streptococcus gordonii]KXC04001.1 hypothetical protein AWH02_10055 [Streptococcus gordonii]MBZ2150464.1 DUF262 domain-containing protein [Streptococcus gordonii]QWZ57892.1 DUF262 domain-containing protein [Streptococcus gordonii]SQF29732.1 HNH endonuclease family [Streptococcus gordonii]
MTSTTENLDLKQKIQIICLYFAKLPSNDKRRSKIISKYRELEILSGIKANTIRQWTDSFDPYFDNGRKGYHQRDLKNENKSLWEVYNEYKDFSLSELQNKVSEIYKKLDKNSYFLCKGDKEVYLYSIKTKKEETSTSLYNLDATTEIIDYNVRIDNLNRYNPKTSNSQKLKVGDLLFLSLGGDSEKWKEWENGLTAIGQVENIYVENSTNNYEITAKVLIKLPTEITPSDLYYYPDTSNEFNIGPSLKGTPNQAINRVSTKGALSIFSAICDLFPDYKNSIKLLIGDENFKSLDNVPKLLTDGEYEENSLKNSLNLDFEGNDDLLDKINLSSDENFIDQSEALEAVLEMDKDDNKFKSDMEKLMTLPANELKRQLSVTQRELSISDIKKFYDRFIEFQNEYSSNVGIDYTDLGDALILEPSFQREYVWNQPKKQQLVDSILLGIPIPTFYFSIDKNGNLLVVDGKQRINSILEFLEGKLSLPSSYRFLCLDKDSKHDVHFKELESRVKRKFEDYPLTCYLVDSSVIPRFQNEIFMRVNRGGERLTIQEIRNASNVGKVTYLLNKISDNKELRIVPTKRKKDQYLVLRFLAYYLIHNNDSFMSIYNFDSDYDGIDNLLDRVMKFINIISDSEVKKLYSLYESCIQISKRMFELKSYKEFSRKDSNTVNMIIFESWLFLISSFEKSVIETNLDLFFDFYIKFIGDENFEDNILYRRDSKEKITWRFSYIEKFIKDIKQSLKLKDIL